MSTIEDSILDPFIDHLMAAAEKKCLNNKDLLECVQEARKKMLEDQFVQTMEAALQGQLASPVPFMQVSDRVGIYELEDPKDPPAVGQKVIFGRHGVKKAPPNSSRHCGVLLSIEPGGLTAQVIRER